MITVEYIRVSNDMLAKWQRNVGMVELFWLFCPRPAVATTQGSVAAFLMLMNRAIYLEYKSILINDLDTHLGYFFHWWTTAGF